MATATQARSTGYQGTQVGANGPGKSLDEWNENRVNHWTNGANEPGISLDEWGEETRYVTG